MNKIKSKRQITLAVIAIAWALILITVDKSFENDRLLPISVRGSGNLPSGMKNLVERLSNGATPELARRLDSDELADTFWRFVTIELTIPPERKSISLTLPGRGILSIKAPGNYEMINMLLHSLRQTDKAKVAVKAYIQASAFNPEFAGALGYSGFPNIMTGDNAHAAADFQRLMRLNLSLKRELKTQVSYLTSN